MTSASTSAPRCAADVTAARSRRENRWFDPPRAGALGEVHLARLAREVVDQERRNYLQANHLRGTPAALAVHDHKTFLGRPQQHRPQHAMLADAVDESFDRRDRL